MAALGAAVTFFFAFWSRARVGDLVLGQTPFDAELVRLFRPRLVALGQGVEAVQQRGHRIDHGGAERLLFEVLEERGVERLVPLRRDRPLENATDPREPGVLEGIDLQEEPELLACEHGPTMSEPGGSDGSGS
jgi:hypothetical protein